MAVLDTAILGEIYYHLIEYAGYVAGSTSPSGLYTQAEIWAAFNYRLTDFAKQTGCTVSTSNHLTSVAAQRDYVLPATAIDVLHVAYQPPAHSMVSVPNGSPFEADGLMEDLNTSVSVPYIWTLELADVNSISLLPPPLDSSRTIHLIYTKRPTGISSPASGASIDLPDDFVPFIKYGVLADLFSKSGETFDPARAGVCEMLYQLGIQTVKIWVQGPPS